MIRIAAGLDRLGEHLLELGRGEEVDLAAHREDVALAVDRVLGDRELRWHLLPLGRSWIGAARRSPAGCAGTRRRRRRRTAARARPLPVRARYRSRAARPTRRGASAPSATQRADVQLDRAVLGDDADVDAPVLGEVRGLGGDRVGDQQRVVEAVDRAVRARGEDADDAPEHGRGERAARQADGCLVEAGSTLMRPSTPRRGGTSCAPRCGRRRPCRARATRRASRSAAGRGRGRASPAAGRCRGRCRG